MALGMVTGGRVPFETKEGNNDMHISEFIAPVAYGLAAYGLFDWLMSLAAV